MMSLANSTILLGDGAGWFQSGVAIGCFQDLSMFLDESIAGFLGQQIPGLAGDLEIVRQALVISDGL